MTRKIALAALLVVFVAGACGDDDGVGTTAAPDGGNQDTSGGRYGDSGFEGFSNEECTNVVLAWSQAVSAGLVGFGGDFEASAETLADLAASVPPEISADFALYSQAIAEYGAALQAAGIDFSNPATYSSAEAQAAMTAAADAFQATGVEEAGENIGDFLDAQCGEG